MRNVYYRESGLEMVSKTVHHKTSGDFAQKIAKNNVQFRPTAGVTAKMSNEWFVREVSQFDTVLSSALATGKPVLVYLYGNWNEGTCESWCGDCRDGSTFIQPILLKLLNNFYFKSRCNCS